MQLPFTIQIPVFNETHALEFSISHYRRAAIDVSYVLDSKRDPRSEAILRSHGLATPVFENSKPFIENGYESFAAAAPTDWILRLDCDELASLELLEFCRDFIRNGGSGIVGFERHQLTWRDGRFRTATTDRFTPPNQRQWRLFDRRHVRFDSRIHTPGIEVSEPVIAPGTAVIYHLSWIFLSWNDRLEKAARYDDHGQPSANRANQLFPLEDVSWADLDVPLLQASYEDWLRVSNTP